MEERATEREPPPDGSVSCLLCSVDAIGQLQGVLSSNARRYADSLRLGDLCATM